MISPAATALASSVACIATTSSWWVATRRVCVISEPERPNPKALQALNVDAMSSVTRPSAGQHGDVHQALIASGIFRKTDPDVVSAVIKRMRPVRFPPGHVVFAQGDPGGCLYMIASGKVKVAYRHTDGREFVLNVVGASDVFGEVTPFDCGTREVHRYRRDRGMCGGDRARSTPGLDGRVPGDHPPDHCVYWRAARR